MRKLTKIIAPALFASMALGAVVPAEAATPVRAESVRHEIAGLQRAVSRLDARDRISQREANALRRDVRHLSDQFRVYNRNGLSRSEYRTLERRIETIKARMHFEKHDRNGHRW